MVKKKILKDKKANSKKKEFEEKKKKALDEKKFPTLKFKKESDIAQDFAVKVYKKFDKMIKSVILFGSVAKKEAVAGSDIDIIIVLDDVSIKWDAEMIAWYRTELEKTIRANPYREGLHINTIKLSTWWEDLLRGEPILLNIIRYGESMIDFGGFFEPLKHLLIEGKIKSTPEAIYNSLNRAPEHLIRSRMAGLSSVDGIFWSMVDSAHALLIASNITPSSPEHIPVDLKTYFVDAGKLNVKYLNWYREILDLHKRINHGEVRDLKNVNIHDLHMKAEEFLAVMAKTIKEII